LIRREIILAIMEANLSAKSFEIILNLKFATTIGLDSFIEVAP